jgi:hypothetical protein
MSVPPSRATAAREGDVGSGRLLHEFTPDARSLGTEGFEARHGSAFLLLAAVRPRSAQNSYSTHLELMGDEEAGEKTGTLATLVYPLRSSVHLVSVGRAPDNDVVIPDRSISRRHAFVKRGAQGGFQMLDAGSSNGTTINGATVYAKGAGPPSTLASGDTVKLGGLEFTFVDAAGFQKFAASGR